MADLDDFFAKKDKKKNKGKKFTSAEELARKLEDTSKRATEPQKPRKEHSAIKNASCDDDEVNNVDQHKDDEWKDFEEEERKDYTGLKIGQLTISEEEQNATNNDQDGDNGNEGYSDVEGHPGSSERKTGPWKKVTPAEEVTQIPVDMEKSKVYVTPALRSQTAKAPKVKNRAAPDITNEEYFPTLGAARPEEQRKKKNEPAFEEVRHGSRITRVPEIQSSAVSVANRFKSLADDDS
uniref:Protein CDV3 homolog n=1 Tax=Tabanus bromius TaxID=304241 RepID=A0A0K8TNY5_TABBR